MSIATRRSFPLVGGAAGHETTQCACAKFSILKFKGQSRPHFRRASYRIDGYIQPAAACRDLPRLQQNMSICHDSTTQIGFLDSRGQGDLLPACEPLAATVNGLRSQRRGNLLTTYIVMLSLWPLPCCNFITSLSRYILLSDLSSLRLLLNAPENSVRPHRS